jgi:hypothetical protein
LSFSEVEDLLTDLDCGPPAYLKSNNVDEYLIERKLGAIKFDINTILGTQII